MEVLQQGRRWLKEGEPPQAVLQEAEEQLKGGASAGWKLLAAEARLALGEAEAALPLASEALVLFKQMSDHQGEVEATGILVSSMVPKDARAAADLADATASVCRDAGDVPGEAAMMLLKARALLACMEDPYAAAQSAISSCLLYREVKDCSGEAAALELAARAHLLYDPEQALKAAKEALATASAGDLTALPRIERTLAAAKAQLATAQKAEQAKSLSCRGQSGAAYKWPLVPQLRGPPAVDVFAKETPQAVQRREEVSTSNTDKAGVKFARKAFKWTMGNHKTDEAWFRQELTYLPPPNE